MCLARSALLEHCICTSGFGCTARSRFAIRDARARESCAYGAFVLIVLLCDAARQLTLATRVRERDASQIHNTAYRTYRSTYRGPLSKQQSRPRAITVTGLHVCVRTRPCAEPEGQRYRHTGTPRPRETCPTPCGGAGETVATQPRPPQQLGSWAALWSHNHHGTHSGLCVF